MNQLQDELEELRFNWIISALKMENIPTDFKVERKLNKVRSRERRGESMISYGRPVTQEWSVDAGKERERESETSISLFSILAGSCEADIKLSR